MLIIAECWHPDWIAVIDGQTQKVFRVNYLQQGIWLEPGRHTVEMRFFPRSLIYGTVVSAMSVLMIGTVLPGRCSTAQPTWGYSTDHHPFTRTP